MSQKFDSASYNPDGHSPYCATTTYAPLVSHLEKSFSYVDDIESFIYMAVEFTTGSLPWKGCDDTELVKVYKQEAREEPKKLFKDCPKEYEDIFTDACLRVSV